jgi:hypothetical protein
VVVTNADEVVEVFVVVTNADEVVESVVEVTNADEVVESVVEVTNSVEIVESVVVATIVYEVVESIVVVPIVDGMLDRVVGDTLVVMQALKSAFLRGLSLFSFGDSQSGSSSSRIIVLFSINCCNQAKSQSQCQSLCAKFTATVPLFRIALLNIPSGSVFKLFLCRKT